MTNWVWRRRHYLGGGGSGGGWPKHDLTVGGDDAPTINPAYYRGFRLGTFAEITATDAGDPTGSVADCTFRGFIATVGPHELTLPFWIGTYTDIKLVDGVIDGRVYGFRSPTIPVVGGEWQMGIMTTFYLGADVASLGGTGLTPVLEVTLQDPAPGSSITLTDWSWMATPTPPGY